MYAALGLPSSLVVFRNRNSYASVSGVGMTAPTRHVSVSALVSNREGDPAMAAKSAAGAHSENDSTTKPRRINIALQGGGSHGAFAWGVIDRLLEHGGVEIEGIVGTSAGAMNAAVTAYGLTKGGREGARGRLYAFWHSISEAARFSLLQPPPWSKLMEPNSGSLDMAPGYIFSDFISRMFSPYQTNPDRKSTRLNSSHIQKSRMPSSA